MPLPPPTHVADLMTHEVCSVAEYTPFKEIVRVLAGHRIHGVPVVDAGNRVVGVVTTSDLLARVAGADHPMPRGHRTHAHADNARKRRGDTAAELMTTPPITVLPTAEVAEAARLAARSRVRSLPVVDPDGVLLGVVTRDDLVRVFLRPDDEIARDVRRIVVTELSAPLSVEVGVTVVDGVVVLTGTVPSASSAQRLAADARQVPGVVDVRDDLDEALDQQGEQAYVRTEV